MIILYAPAGANCNYISAILNDPSQQIKSTIVYHLLGTHAGSIKVVGPYENINIIEKYVNDKKNVGCIFHHWNSSEYDQILKKENVIPFQIYIDDYKELVLINWFEKFLHNPSYNQDYIASQEWIQTQKIHWEKYTKFTGERAVVHWIYKIFLNLIPEFKNNSLFEKKFNFSSMYKSFELSKKEFKKFNIEYTETMYNNWKDSQKIPINSWNMIKNNIETPENLEHFYQRGVAIALNGVKHKVEEQDCWNRLSKRLK